MSTRKISSSRAVPRARVAWLPAALTTEAVILGVLLVAALLTRLVMLGARVMSHDESLHVYFSWQLADGRGFAHNPMMHGPSLFELTGLIDLIFGANDFTSRLGPALVGIAMVIVLPQLLKPYLGRAGALATSLFLVLSPYVTYFSRYIRHDILVIAALLLAIYAIFEYRASRRERFLYILAAAEALMLSTMEISFIYLAILALFLALAALKRCGFHWGALRASAEFDLILILASLGAFFSSPIALLLLNPIWKRISGLPFVALKVFNTQDLSWANGPEAVRIWGLLLVFSLAAIAVGLWWGRARWLKIAGVFGVIVLALFTTFMTHPSGLGTGLVGSLGYWLSQQEVARGTQPWYYYGIVFSLYEYLAIAGALGAIGYYVIGKVSGSRSGGHPASRERTEKALPARERGDRGRGKAAEKPAEEGVWDPPQDFIPFLIWWLAAITVGLTIAGEKMPWLSTHIAVPALLLSGWWAGELLSGPEGDAGRLFAPFHGAGRPLALGLLLVLALLTARTSYLANFVNYDYTTEYIDYAHSAPGVRWLMDDIETIGDKTASGKLLKVGYDSDVAWPLNWYLREYSAQNYFAEQPDSRLLEAPVVIAGDVTWSKVESLLGSNYYRFELIRMWWPLEDYKGLTWKQVMDNLRDPEMRRALWEIVWRRDYSRYAALTGQVIDPPAHWPLSDLMRVYIRKDLAVDYEGLKLWPYKIEDAENFAGAYDSVKIEPEPEQMVSAGQLSAPRGLAAAADGSLYVADTGNGRIVHLDPHSDTLTSWGSHSTGETSPGSQGTFLDPWGIAVGPQGEIYIADTWNYRVQKFDAQGNFVLSFGQPGLLRDGPDRLWGPRGVAAGPDGSVYVSDTGNKRIAVFDAQGAFLRQFGDQGEGQLNEPVGIAVSSTGEVFVADTWNQRVAVFSADGEFLRDWPIAGWMGDSLDNKPHLALDSSGRVYIVDPELFRVVIFSPEGRPLASFGTYGNAPDAFGLPAGIAVDADGTIWISDAGNNRVVGYASPFGEQTPS